MNPLVSIIVPVYNVESYIQKCLDSIVNQTYKNLEIILIDDGSTDNSGKICDEYAKLDKRIIVKHNTNKGVSHTRNYGINLSNGEYLSFIDSDDYVNLDYIENLLNPIIEEDYDLTICNLDHIFTNNVKNNIVDIKLLSQNYYDDFYVLNILRITPCNKLFKTKIISSFKIKFNENISYSEDCLFNYEYAKYVKKYKYVNKVMYHYCHIRENSLSSKKNINAFNDAMLALSYEKRFLEQYNVKKKEIILTNSAIGHISTFKVLKNEQGAQYKIFYERVQKIRSIVGSYFYHDELKRKLVSICLKYNIILPLYFYYCIFKQSIERK